ncbi:efflux RND transporter permease subunit [Aquimarina pacifica]|uniref:efflux RND transporter permease subunit n=1 Tax=Aquimarina pacifica TaxID=1296415 RepID=UPI000471F3D5|nr:efflux RND transporter permease subunit [Aquimarina pacifica]
MLNRSIKFILEHKIIAVLILLVSVGVGISTAPFDWRSGILPSAPVAVDAIPDIGENQQIIFTKWPGHSPQDIEDQITYPLSTALSGIAGVKTIRSSSMFGFSSIYIIFEDTIEFYWSRSRILEKLNALPDELLPKGIRPSLGPDATGLGQIFWYTIEGRDENGNVTGGWDLHELRTIQEYYVKKSLSSASGVAEVASIGGYVKEYQIDIDPELIRQYGIDLNQIVVAVKQSNRDVGAQTIEVNQVEYIVRGLGYINSIEDIENTVITSHEYTSIRIKDIAKVSIGPAARRGILDKEGAEVVGGVAVARYGANPLEVIDNVKSKIRELSLGLPSKKLRDGRTSKLTIVPFYDRSELIKETLGTLNEALTLEILITILVIILMVFNLRASILISGLLPVVVLVVFIFMKLLDIDANIVALSGIAIAIGTIVDVGIILLENIISNLNNNKENISTDVVVYNATTEVSGAILTAVVTTIISFIPVFLLIGSEGKLFRPLAYTKTIALIASLVVGLFIIPPFSAFLFKKKNIKKWMQYVINLFIFVVGCITLLKGMWLGIALLIFAITSILWLLKICSKKRVNQVYMIVSVGVVLVLLSEYWHPLGVHKPILFNFTFVTVIFCGILGIFILFKRFYQQILEWALKHKLTFLSIPFCFLLISFLIFKNTGREFMPSLDEGSFLLMPTSVAHAGIAENKRILQQLDMAVAHIPEIRTVVGKAGRVESALDPAPLSMYENVIHYKPEYMCNDDGERERYKVTKDGLFVCQDGSLVNNKNIQVDSDVKIKKPLKEFFLIERKDLIVDKNGEFYRNWRPEIRNSNDIWNEIIKVTKLPGITSAPKLQPIETRLLMLQTGMRSPMGVKVKGQNLEEIEAFSTQLEQIIKEVPGVKSEAVFADKMIGKPYLHIDINREKLVRYGIAIETIQQIIEVAIGGKTLTQTIEGRERYNVRIRYPRDARDTPNDLSKISIPIGNKNNVTLSELATIRYHKGPQVIKSEDAFLVGYVLFDKESDASTLDIIKISKEIIKSRIENGQISIPEGVSYQFTGTYENQVRAEKTLSFVIPLVLLTIFLILYFQFRSITTSIIIFIGIAVAFSGGFLMIWLYGQDWFMNVHIGSNNLRELFQIHPINLSVAVWVGFIALFGIATDDGVVMATYLSNIFDKNNPKSIIEIRKSIIEAGVKRIRPCLMTTATTILALLPILTSTGRGSDIMIPMAIPIFGGMTIALLTLFVVPVLFCLKEEIQLKNLNKINL